MVEFNAAIVCVVETWLDDLVMDCMVQHHEQRSICSEIKNSPTEKKTLYDCFKQKGLHIIHFNARSLLPKLVEILYFGGRV